MPFFNKYPLTFLLLVHPHSTSLLFQFHFLFKYFSSLKFYGPGNVIQLALLPDSLYVIWFALCHPTCVMICPARLATRLELKCNSFCISIRIATSNYSKSFLIIRNDLQLLELKSSHLKTIFTLLALRPLHDLRRKL